MTTTRPPNDSLPGLPESKPAGLSVEEAYALHQAEEREFERVYKSLYRELAMYARFKCDTKEAAEDVLQKVWMKAYLEKTIALCGADLQRIARYLRKMLRNQAADDAEHERSQLQRAADYALARRTRIKEPETPYQHALTRDMDSQLVKGIRSLPPGCAEVFILVRFCHVSYAKVAEELDVSFTTVAAHMRTAAVRLESHPALADYLLPDVEDTGKGDTL